MGGASIIYTRTLLSNLLLFSSRHVLAESARIARGNVTDLRSLNTKDYDAILFPGGFGVAKNL